MENFKIRDLQVGQSAVITGYEAGDHTYKSKLLSMGLTKSTVIKLIKVAPLGDPIEIEVRGFHLSLRKDEAGVILLKTNE
jgi:ferrous iron transport protein A